MVFGKTNTPEFGAKGITEPELFGPARNPWDLDRTPGGSSGGSAAAVAAGIVPVAGASDGGGSIRIPAACCGLFGLKAGRGLIPFGPRAGEPLHGAATNGVISRSVRDSAAMLDVLAGPDADRPLRPRMPTGRFLDEVGQDPGRLRIGVRTAVGDQRQPAPRAPSPPSTRRPSCWSRSATTSSRVDRAVRRRRARAATSCNIWFVYAAYEVAEIKRAHRLPATRASSSTR